MNFKSVTGWGQREPDECSDGATEAKGNLVIDESASGAKGNQVIFESM